MKTKSQVRLNVSSSNRSKQPQIPQKPSAPSRIPQPEQTSTAASEDEFAKPNWECPSCLCVYDRASQGPVKRIPLNDDELHNVMMFCIRDEYSGGAGFEQFVAEAIREKLAVSNAQSTAQTRFKDVISNFSGSLGGMSSQLDTATVLIDAMMDVLERWQDPPSEKEANRVLTGFSSLTLDFEKSSQRKFSAVQEEWRHVVAALDGHNGQKLKSALASRAA